MLADWIVGGRPTMDLWDVDVRRMMPFQNNRRYLRERTTESARPALRHALAVPPAGDRARRAPLHRCTTAWPRTAPASARWPAGSAPNWFAPKGVTPAYEYTYGRQNWFEYSAAEHMAAREGVGLFDQTFFAKFLLAGRDAERVLQRVCANDVAVPVGKVVYTQWLNERGGIEADVTVTRLADDQYLVVTGTAQQVRDFDWLRRHIPDDAHATLTDVTSGSGDARRDGAEVSARCCPRSPTRISPTPPSPSAPRRRSTCTSPACGRPASPTSANSAGSSTCRPRCVPGVFDALMEAGAAHGIRLAGYHALNSLRLEKGYRHWGHDIGVEDTPLEAGLGFAVAWDKAGGFIGREALLAERGKPRTKRMVQVVLDSPEPLMYHEEPIYKDGVIVGSTTSAMFGHAVGRAVALGYVHNEAGVSAEWLASGGFEVEIACERFAAKASLRPVYDPKAERPKA